MPVLRFKGLPPSHPSHGSDVFVSGVGLWGPGEERNVSDATAAVLLDSGLYTEAAPPKAAAPDVTPPPNKSSGKPAKGASK